MTSAGNVCVVVVVGWELLSGGRAGGKDRIK
jgi:hypothetical protein